MLSFFRSFAPYQYLSLLAVLLLIRLPLLITPLPLLIPELNWMLVGEQMRQGYTLYSDIWDSVSPFSAGVYWFIDLAVGRSQGVYWAVATGVSIFQLMYFNYIMNAREVFSERSFWPGLFYALFLNLSFDCATLSPVLMSLTFLLLAFGALIRQLGRQGATDEVFEVGIYVGLAALFYLPSGLFILWASLSLLFFTGATFRQHSLTVFGFAFPILLVVFYYYFTDSLDDFNRNLLTSVFRVRQYDLSDFKTLFASLIVPLSIGVLGFLNLFNSVNRYVNFQQRCQQIMLMWAITAVLTIPLMPFLAPMLFLTFVPPMAFFAVLYFASFRKVWLRELAFLGVVLAIAGVLYQGVMRLLPGVEVGLLSSLQVKPSSLPDRIRNRKVLIIGEDLSGYRYNRPATPYLNWDLAKYDLRNLDNYEAVIDIYDKFQQDPPDFVVDRQQVIPKLFQRVPALAARYKTTETPGIYERIR
ncbi:hypothetical protein [Fibrivirga algicola]|uniref:Glycosyltransferase RgtA/B/C/D-like domain-containing protein n=1 Tax=Fibrivirga algicola TaxID=2950420 RepID=A0ABX0QPT6_9BACT|nr:hypothetical protein [Fibrivirga algicola]NID13281.1 hypothetical protein [Fibrivirga algicola]